MKNGKIVTLIATLGLITCLHTKVDAIKFYDTLGTRYEGAVERLAELEIIEGVSDKTFNAKRSITRAEFAKLIVQSSLTEEEIDALTIDDDHCTFTDISKDAWYYKFVVAATNYGYINGYTDNTFRPNKEVTYEEATKMFMKALGHNYLVETDPRGWSAEYMDKMYSLNIADGTSEFKKEDNATRGNIAIMLWNTLTNNIWEKILLNDVAGFTYVDSGRSLFDKKVKGHVYKENLKIEGFKEINGKLCIQTSGTVYEQLYDQDITINFSMIGGKSDVLYKIIRYPYNEIKYEIIGLSPDIGTQLYTGTVDELKADGVNLRVKTSKFSNDTDFGYYIKADDEDESRLLYVNTKARRFHVDKIDIKTESETVKEDEDAIIEDENDLGYLYRSEYSLSTKTITINEDYEIKDGAVLFENNKWVDWKTVKEGDIITEIKKDRYYFLSREVKDVIIKGYERKNDGILFSTSIGPIFAYENAGCIEYYSQDNKVIFLSKYKESKLDKLIDSNVRFHLDFAGNAARIDILDDYYETEKVSSLQKLGMGYYYALDYGEDEKINMLTLLHDGKKKVYKTKLKGIDADIGELVLCTFNDKNIVTEVKVISNGTEINEKFKLNKITYEKLEENIEKENIVENCTVYYSKYHYDFGEYEKVTKHEVKKIDVKEIKDLNNDKVEYYAVYDTDDCINIILCMDYSEKKEIFYGIADRIYMVEGGALKASINVIGYKDLTYTLSGLVNCEEGDLISFKLLGKDTIKILESFSPKALGYYKDIIVKSIVYNHKITAENGDVYINDNRIVTSDNEYVISDFDIILVNVEKDDKGAWKILNGKEYTLKDLRIYKNDRIAINEIENTIIVYRGYRD